MALVSWLQSHPAKDTLVLLVVLVAVGLLVMASARTESYRGLGAGLISGGVVTLAVFLLQISIDNAKDQASHAADIASFRLAVSLQNNLTGFDYTGHDMKGFYLSGKVMHNADLRGVDLQDAMLHSTDLAYADLEDANLQGAYAHGASFYNASLVKADLRRADLRNATFLDANLDGAKLTGAIVDASTCWPRGFLTLEVRAQLKTSPLVRRGVTSQSSSAGHTCDSKEKTPR